jgi:dolichol-phosphate mannosyltransferase
MHFSIVIPFLNEADNIEHLTIILNDFFRKRINLKAEVIFVDDGSTDNSLNLLRQAKHEYYTPKIIKLSKNYGSHAALRAGILHAKGEFVCFMYADLQDPLELIDKMYHVALQGNEIVWAVRSKTQMSFFEKAFSELYAYLMQKYVIKSFPSKGFDVVMFGKKVKEELNKNIEANSSIFLQILTMGFRQATIEYDKQARKAGKSKWTFGKKIKLFIDSFVAFSFFPIRLVSVVGIILFLTGTLFAFYLILRKLLLDDIKEGWTALASILMIGFGVTNISLGIIAEYLWRTLDASRKRPVFIIDEIITTKKVDE